jgi:hypothetical protein
MRSKYGSVRTWSQLCNRFFDSKLECKRGEELRMMEMAGEIDQLEYQYQFILCEKPKVTITLDFAYRGPNQRHWEDAKGVLTRDTRTKLAWLKEKYGIEVEIYRG